MNSINVMKVILVKAVLLILFLTQGAHAIDVKQIRARNDVAEQGLMNLRIERAKAILAGTDPQVSWQNKVVQLNGFVSDANSYANGQPNSNYSLAINASQQLIKELAVKYNKRVYGSKSRENVEQDPILANFMSSFRILKRMEKHPEQHVALYATLQQQMLELDNLANNSTTEVNP